MENKTYFVIVAKPILKFLTANGVFTSFIQDAKHFLTISDANKQLDTFDKPEDYAVYKVVEFTQYNFELEE